MMSRTVSDRVLVSVVTAVPDARAALDGALRSVLASDLSELEVIVVENGPMDGPVADVQDPRIVRVTMRPGQRALRLRNVGIARASAPYVALLDPDDVLKPNKLSATVSALDRNPDAGFAFSDFECIDESGAVVRSSALTDTAHLPTLTNEGREGNWHLIRQAVFARGLLYQNPIGTSGVVIRRNLLTEIGPFAEVAGPCADLDYWFRLAHCRDALYSSEVGYSHREGVAARNGSTGSASKCYIEVLRREKERWSDRAARRQLDRVIADNLARIAADQRLRRRRFRSAAGFAHAFATSPDVRWLDGMLRSILA